jgi:hypothetical protein
MIDPHRERGLTKESLDFSACDVEAWEFMENPQKFDS